MAQSIVQRGRFLQFLMRSLLGSCEAELITCGFNGRIWIKGLNIRETIAVYRTIRDSEFIAEPDIPILVDKQIRQLRGFPVDNEMNI
ncbi:unnamed protein product [Gongylonema pulchrum]|uniref:KH_dom_type_1 domain-containing protein n=1 Tax=Gongylonema pulchrum TaxID=637853 RepID=A0A183DVE9_9BILA|nr:unnamed protein product [Gongylonema pulchrum]